jgi:hypothetical protein
MIGLRIGAAELAEIEAGAPFVVLAPGMVLPPCPPLLALSLAAGSLTRPGSTPAHQLPLPRWARPLALIGPEAERLSPLLPAGVPVAADATALLGVLAGALREASASRVAAEADRDRLLRALATPPPLARRVTDLPPSKATMAPPVTLPLGRAAEGICGVELHLAAPGGGLNMRLLAGGRVLGRWRLSAAALAPGWLALDLPQPAPPGPAEAVLEIIPEDQGASPLLSACSAEPGASLALRVNVAPAGWSVLPLHFDWAASFAPCPALPLPLPEAVLAAAEVEGARVELVAAGEEAPRLLAELAAGSEAKIRLPPVPVGATDLLRAHLLLPNPGPGMSAAIAVSTEGGTVESGWRDVAPDLPLALPLRPGPMARITIALRNTGIGPGTVEVSALALMLGAGGEPRRLPPPAAVAAPRLSVALPPERRAGRTAPLPPVPLPGPTLPSPSVVPGSIGFREVRLNQHLVNADGSYRHLDIGISGLVSGGGLWRQLRLKLFERRGIAGLEFRDAKGWPAMFDTWPGTVGDQYGPFWRLETEGAAAALARLATPHDRALVSALLEVLPDLASRAAAAAALSVAEREAWAGCARRLLAGVAAARRTR